MIKMDKEVDIRINPDIIHGTLASISCRERMHVMWIEDEWSALIQMVKFMQKVEEGKYMVPSKREPITLMARYLGITPLQTEHLMMTYPSLVELAKASSHDLQRIPGIGKVKAATILERLNTQWS